MRGYVEFNLSQRCFGPAQFEATLLRQTYLRKIVPSRQKKKKRFPVSFFFFSFLFLSCFRFIVFVSFAFHCKSRRIEWIGCARTKNVGQRHRIDVSPRFPPPPPSLFLLLLQFYSNKIPVPGYSRVACPSFEKLGFSPAASPCCVLTFSQHAIFATRETSFYKTRTRATTYLSSLLLLFKKIGNNQIGRAHV